MTLILQPGVPEDMEEFTEVFLESFRNDAVHPNLMRNVPHDEKVACYAEMLRKELENPWVKDFKIVDTETSKIAAWARFEYPHEIPPSSTSNVEGQNVIEARLGEMSLPDGANEPLITALFIKFGEIKSKHLDSKRMYYVGGLCTLPEYQHRGLGKLLMEQGLNDAEKEGAKTFLLASPAGKPFYHKLGFKDLEEQVLDWRDLGATDLRTTTAQIFDPKKSAGLNGAI